MTHALRKHLSWVLVCPAAPVTASHASLPERLSTNHPEEQLPHAQVTSFIGEAFCIDLMCQPQAGEQGISV